MALVPAHGGPDTFARTAARVATLDKPVVVGALSHPGYVAVWRPDAFDATSENAWSEGCAITGMA
jgi:hypothetical protein